MESLGGGIGSNKHVDGAITDGMHTDLQARPVGLHDEVADDLFAVVQAPARVGPINVGLIEAGRMLEASPVDCQAALDPWETEVEHSPDIHCLVHENHVDGQALGDGVQSEDIPVPLDKLAFQTVERGYAFARRPAGHAAVEQGNLLVGEATEGEASGGEMALIVQEPASLVGRSAKR